MSLLTPTKYWPPDHTRKSLSGLAAGITILATAFVSHLVFRYCEPKSRQSRLVLLLVVPVFLSTPISYTGRSLYSTIPLAFTTYTGALILFTLAYRLSPFHPLAKYPGPVIAKTSKWWAAYISARGDSHRYYKYLHDIYGDVVRIGPNELSIRDASLIHPVLGKGGLPKGPRWERRSGRPSLLTQRDPVKHMQQRKPWNQAFSSTAVKEYEGIVANRIRQLLGCLENLMHESDRKESSPLDIAAWLRYFSIDLMGDMTFGGGFSLMKDGGDMEGFWTLIVSGLQISAITAHIPYIVPILDSLTGKSGTVPRARSFGRERVLQRLKSGASKKDLFYHLSGEGLSEAERPSVHAVAQDGGLAIIAGSDTTSSVLTGLLYYLLLNPRAYKRLQEEIDSAFTRGEEPLDTVKSSRLEWLNGCINEALRLQPPVPSGSQRSVNKGEGAKVLKNLVIPEQTQLTLHTYSILRDARNFHTPDMFLPERWLNEGAPAGAHNTAAFIPFSYGPTMCVGKRFALMEMRMLLCWVLRRFQFSKVPGVNYAEWERNIQDWYVVHQEPLVVNVSLRE